MPRPTISRLEIETIAKRLVEHGLSDKELDNAVELAVRDLMEQKESEEFAKKSTLGQAWWALQRGYHGAGSMLGSIPGALLSLVSGRPSAVRSPIDIYQETVSEPFKPVPPPVGEEAPGAVKLGAGIAGSLMRDLPLLGLGAKGISGLASLGQAPRAGILGKAAYAAGRPLAIARAGAPKLTSMAETGALFEALGQVGGGSPGAGFASGVALSALPLMMMRSPRFLPKTMPGGMTNPYALPRAVQASLMGAGAAGGLTVRDLMAGLSIPEQFDISTPEGQQSLISKALGFAFTARSAAKRGRMIEEAGKAQRGKMWDRAREIHEGMKAESKALEAIMEKAPESLSPEAVKARLLQSPDKTIRKLAKVLKIEVKKDDLTSTEQEYMAARKTSEMLDVTDPLRESLTPAGRERILNKIYKTYPRNQAEGIASLSKEQKAGELIYKFIHTTDKEVPKSPAPPTGPIRQGKIKGGRGEGMWIDPKTNKVRFNKPRIDPVTEAQRMEAHHLYKKSFAAMKMYEHVMEPRRGVEAARLRALSHTIGYRPAKELYRSVAQFKPKELAIHDYMTASQYAEFLQIYKGEMGRLLRMLEIESFRQTGQIRPVKAVIEANFQENIPPGIQENASVRQQVSDAGLSHYIRGSAMRLLRHQDKNPGDPTGTLWYFLSDAQTESHRLHQDIQLVQKWIWTKDLPSAAMTRKWRPFQDYVSHIFAPKDAVTAGITKLPIEQVAKSVKWAGTPAQLHSLASNVAKDLRVVYNWMFTRNGMSLSRFRDNYMPLLRRWVDSGMKTPLDSFMVNQGLSEIESKNFSELLRRLATPPSQRVVPGAKEPFYEKPRKITEDAAKLLTYEKNPIYAMDKYARMLARRTIKEPLLPLANDIVSQIRANHANEPGGGTRIIKSVKWFLDSWWGQPSSLDRLAEGYHPFMSGYNWFREHLPGGRKMLPALTEDNYHGVRDLFDFVTTGAYGVTLGYNPMSILKNLTQSSHSTAMFGYKKTLKGLGKYMGDPAFRKRVEDLRGKIRTQYLDFTPAELTKLQRAASKFTKTGLAGFGWADRMNVNNSISSSILSWDEAMAFLGGRKPTPEMKAPFLEKLNLKRMRWAKYFWDRFRRLPGIEKEYRKTYAGTESLGDLVWNDVVRGNYDRALLQYSKFMTYLTQYAYGAPESAPLFRGSFNRLLFMYTSWPINYTEFLSSMMSSRTGREWLRLAAFWLPFGAIAAASGTKAYQWFGFGPYPTEIALQSPITGVVGSTYRAASNLSRASQAWLFGAEDDYYLNSAPGQLTDTLEEYEMMVPGRRLYQFLNPEEEE